MSGTHAIDDIEQHGHGGSDWVSPHRDEVLAKTPFCLNFIADTDLNLQNRDLALSQILNLAKFF